MKWFALLALALMSLAGCIEGEEDGDGATGAGPGQGFGGGSGGGGGGPAGAPVDDPGADPQPPAAPDDASDCEEAPDIPVGLHPVATISTNKGDIEADLFAEHAPMTVANFVCLAQAGYFDGIGFHRIISDFMMQGGDPNTLDSDPGNDGQGGPGYNIADEFHWDLRHDRGGLLSMANAGRGTGGSQFFVTFVATSWLDDRHTIFGEVRNDSMPVVEGVNQDAASSDGTPKEEVRIETVQIGWESTGAQPVGDVALSTPLDTLSAAPGGTTRFIVVVENLEDHRINVELDGGEAGIEDDFGSFSLPARQRAAVVVEAGSGDHPVTADGGGDTASLVLHVDEDDGIGPSKARNGDSVTANYIGMTPDGRLFDTSLYQAAQYAGDDGWFELFGPRGSESAYSTFSFTPGSGVIDGFTELSVGTLEGASTAGRMPPEKAYGSGGCGQRPCLAGMTLIFHLELVEIA